MSKSDILAEEIETKKIELLQERINNNSKLINDLTNKLVDDYCKQLDDYVRFIQSILQDDKHPPTAEELDDFCMNIPTLLFFCRRGSGKFRYKIRYSQINKTRKV